MKKYLSDEMMNKFSTQVSAVRSRTELRFLFFDSFPVSYVVPEKYHTYFFRIAKKFYDEKGNGYNGIIKEIADRMEIAKFTGKDLTVNDFLKHTDKETDFFDPSIKKAFEKKTGCGDWLIDKNATTLEKAIAIYTRKQRLLRWDYDFTPNSEDMMGKKSFNKKDYNPQEIATMQERSKTKSDGTKVTNKQYAINIHIETTYRKFFEYLRLYPSGIETFFKMSVRSGGDSATYVWQLQTIKNSKKKIEFLEHYNTWCETGLTLAEYKAMKEKEEG